VIGRRARSRASSRRVWSSRIASGRRKVTFGLPLVLVGSLLVMLPIPALAAPRPAVQRIPSVPVRDLVDTAPVLPPPRDTPPPKVTWPAGGAAVVDTSTAGAAGVRAGGLPVRVGAVSGQKAPGGRVRVEVLDQANSAKTGRAGVLMRVDRLDASVARVGLTVDYAGFAAAAGGDWAGRLHLVRLPECALRTPTAQACQPTALPSTNDRSAKTVSTDLDLTAGVDGADADGVTAGLVMVTAAATSLTGGGDYTATSLRASSSWQAGGSSGNFSWTYPLRMPAGLGGPVPRVSFGYSSQSLDGLTAASNNQPSWVGDGFGYNPGFIERGYKPCTDDGQTNVGDQCWSTDNATLSLSGTGGELIQVSTNPDVWRSTNDDGSRIERLRDTSKNNGDNDGEYWRLTDTTGVQYFFGLNRLPGYTSGTETNSAQYVPVFGNNLNEPCYNATFSLAHCQQAYRWNLDYIVDPHGNSMSLWYMRDTNNYARNHTDTTVSTYVRGAVLDRIVYGTHRRAPDGTPTGPDTALAGRAPMRVVFGVADRCVVAGATCTSAQANWPNWPDVPWDQQCTSMLNCAGRYSPSFWTTKRLSTVTTQVEAAVGSWKDVERWTLTHEWKNPGDGHDKTLFLGRIGHTGLVGGSQSVPDVVFSGIQMNNRVDINGSRNPIIRYRISSITTEAGGVISVNYSAKDCVTASKMPANAHTNTFRCFPVYWTQPGQSAPTLDWFHKYVVTSVVEDGKHGSAATVTAYTYPTDAGAWHYDESELTAPSRKTWGQWRGYEQVTVTVGAAGGTQSRTVSRYFRGMHGDKLPSGSRTVSYTVNGTSYNDVNRYAGMTREQIVHNGVGGAVISTTLTEPWSFGPTATRDRLGVVVEAWVTNSLRTTVRTTLDNGRADRVTESTTTYSDASAGPAGRPVQVDNAGDKSSPADDQCTRYWYARNDTAHMHAHLIRVQTVGVNCATTPNQGTQVLSDVRTYHDGATTFGTSISKGDATRGEERSGWDGTNPVYTLTSRSVFDAYGRLTDTWDALDRHTGTTHTHTPAGGPVTATTATGPKGWTTTTTYEPGTGLATRIVDPNDRVTDFTYDPLGRLTAVWRPGRDRSANATPSVRYTYLVRATGGPSAVTTETLNPAGAYVASYALYDGLLRDRQTQSAGVGGGRVITETVYDSRGLPGKTNGPYYNTQSPGTTLVTPTGDNVVPSQTVSTHDGAGRVIASVLMSYAVEKWRTSNAYGGDRTDVTPPAGGVTTSSLTDARGNVVEVRQYNGATPTPWTAGSYDRTTYTYTARGDVDTVTDGTGQISWRYVYDQRGRKTQSQNPDAGTSTYTYDDAGQLLTHADGQGRPLAYTYDELGRKTAVYEGSTAGPKVADWTYDTLLKQVPTGSTRYVGAAAYRVETTGYDAAYRPTGTRVTIPAVEGPLGGTYQFGATYNADDSLATTSIPAVGGLPTETLAYGYNNLGMATTLSGASTYVTQTDYTALGHLALVNLRDGPTGRNLQQYWFWDLPTSRLAEHLVFGDTAPDIAKDTFYTYDNAGHITRAADLLTPHGAGYGPDDTQCFRHDNRGRLAEAWTPETGNCTPAPTMAGVDGATAPYWLTWTFDAAGNRRTQVSHATAGNTTTTYNHPSPGQAQPHTLRTAVTSGPGVNRTDTYDYDAAGNTTGRPGSTGRQTLHWNAEGKLERLQEVGRQDTTFIYDANGNQLIRRDGASATLYLPGMEVTDPSDSSPPTATRYYNHAGQTVAVRGSAGLHWLVADHQGTSQLSFRTSDLVKTQRRTLPYGGPRGPDPAWPGQRGFVGGTKDPSTGLTHLGAREYDPETGRFLSVDPVFDSTDPQSINGYGYGGYSPVAFSDPSGTIRCSDDCSPTDQARSNDTTGPTGDDRRDCRKGDCGNPYRPEDIVEEFRYPNGTVLSKLADGTFLINGLPIPPAFADPYLLAEEADKYAPFARGMTDGWSATEYTVLAACQTGKPGCNTFWMLTMSGDLAIYGARNDPDCGDICLYAQVRLVELAQINVIMAGGEQGERSWGAHGVGKAGAKTFGRLNEDACSFTADTRVLMADGTTRPIGDIRSGDAVLANDPETGKRGARKVVAVWKHDDEVVALDVGGRILMTTEDHPFWNATDRQWQAADALDVDDHLLTADGSPVPVGGLRAGYAQRTLAFNLTVDDISTYYVLAGDTPVLVHNRLCRTFQLANAPMVGGIYIIKFKGGGKNIYVGASEKNIHERLHAAFTDKDHAVRQAGKRPGDVESILWLPLPGTSWNAIRRIEQRQIDFFGGLSGGRLLNRRNEIAE
jgi:RHS repeat-associated protein